MLTDSIFAVTTSLKLSDNTVEITDSIKQSNTGKYPFITNKNPVVKDVIASI